MFGGIAFWRGAARALAAAAGLLAPLGCQDPAQTVVAGDGLTDIHADQVIYGMSTYLTKEGVRTGYLRADSSYGFRDSTTVRLYGVDMTVYTEQGTERARVVADSGRLHQRTEEMVAWGDVVATLPEGDRRIESSELHYDPQSNRIWSDSATTFTEGGRVTRGSCFQSDLQFQNRRVCAIRGAADIGQRARPDTTEGGARQP